ECTEADPGCPGNEIEDILGCERWLKNTLHARKNVMLSQRNDNHIYMLLANMANSPGLRSPPTPRSEVSSPRPKFDSDLLKAYIKKLLSSTLNSASWPESKDRDRVKTWMQEIGER
ncbi:hypothetical protein MPER_01061, partial [Moniliophthora perniciosa FA553]